MEFQESEAQNESETVSEDAQNVSDKQKRGPKKPFRGSKQVYTKIMNQLEFYFSPSNLTKDRFMAKLIQEDPYVPISTFLAFNKIKNLLNGGNESIIKKALSRSTILELSEDQSKVRRKEDAPTKSQEEIDDCTLYVEQIPINSNHESIKLIFERFGKVAYVSLPRYKKSRQIKQFGFVEFEDQESIQKAIQSFKKFDGVLQYASLKAENLLSIATHEKEDKPEAVEEKKEEAEEDTGEPPAKKPKVEEEKPEEVVENENSSQEETQQGEEDSAVEMMEDSATENPEDPEKPAVKKKKNRQHKKKSTASKLLDERIMAMKIMRKKEWKKMRNAYLNLERQKAKEIKKILRESYNKRNNNKVLEMQKFSPVIASPRINFYGSPNERADPTPEVETQQETGATGLTFIPGVIVNIKFREQCLDFKELKKEFKQYAFVQYVDILEGGAQCFIRVDSPNSAQELVSQYSSCEYETDVLKDEAEKEYWKKIFEKRDSKKNKETPKKEQQPPVKRRRGREKLLEKIAKASQHIRFDETEETID